MGLEDWWEIPVPIYNWMDVIGRLGGNLCDSLKLDGCDWKTEWGNGSHLTVF